MSKSDCCNDGCRKTFKDEFKLANFTVDSHHPRHFVVSQCGPKLLYPIWTIVSAIYHVIWLILDIALFNWRPQYFAFFSNWGYMLLVTASVWNCVATCYVHRRRVDILEAGCGSMTWYLKGIWVLFNLANTAAITISIIYFGFIFEGSDNAGSIAKHVFNTIYVIAHICVSAMPIRLLHFYMPLAFIVFYILFTVIYQSGFNNGALYTFLDWNNVNSNQAILFVLITILSLLAHLLFFGLYQLRVYVANRSCQSKSKSPDADAEGSGKLELQLDF